MCYKKVEEVHFMNRRISEAGFQLLKTKLEMERERGKLQVEALRLDLEQQRSVYADTSELLVELNEQSKKG